MTPVDVADPTILIVGTYDTKEDELAYLAERILAAGGSVRRMDVSVLGASSGKVEHARHDVAAAAGGDIAALIERGDENDAMQVMATGATALARELHSEGAFSGVIVLGGSMGTDLALDVCSALPLGVPKYIVSTVSFSPMIPSERLAPDVQMILWAGGLYGLNSICKAVLSQAAGAVVGATRAVEPPRHTRPLVGMTSLGKSALRYMVPLKPALESRGFEVAVFHATGMGGRAFESLAAQGEFACVFDFCTQELGNHVHGSPISAGASRLTGAGAAGIPQLVAPGCHDLVDLVSWHEVPAKWQHHDSHIHNRLITSIVLDAEGRCLVADAHTERLADARAETVMLLPLDGSGEWDREGAPLHDAASYRAFRQRIHERCPANVTLVDVDAHINDVAFAERALAVFDDWCERGIVKRA